MDQLTLVSSNASFGGHQMVYSHQSKELKCKMNFGVYLPPQVESLDVKVPLIYYLSGLTCTEQNFITKAGSQSHAAKHGLIIVAPDTSPRGVKIPGDDDSIDFGTGAGFYLDATQEPWSTNYRMYSYITKELYNLINAAFIDIIATESIGIMGHSMGGHGALICTLRNPNLYKSVSAFSPICNPTKSTWGNKCFSGYLGSNRKDWEQYDACQLVKKYNGPPITLFVDQGNGDEFYEDKQLLPENLVEAARSAQVPIILKMRDGYDHSYYHIATFMGEHLEFHAKILKSITAN